MGAIRDFLTSDTILAIYAVALGILALIAGWMRGIDDTPNNKRFLYRIAWLGPTLSRINGRGWCVCFVVFAITGLLCCGNTENQRKLEAKIQALSDATNEAKASTNEVKAATNEIRT